jgi:hypothetical protein
VSRNPKRFIPAGLPDGSLDPRPLAAMGERWILSWLRDRLSGKDPYLPLDRRSGEDPDALLAGLVRAAGPLDPVSRLIGGAAARLLAEAADHGGAPPAFLPALLRLCQQVRLPDTGPWFSAFVQALAKDQPTVEGCWQAGSIDEVLYGALKQAPGIPGSAAHDGWLALLRSPRYTTYALMALGSSLEAEISHLPTWWETCPARERPRELWRTISRAVKLEGGDRVRGVLAARWSELPAGLRNAIDVALRKLGVATIGRQGNSHGRHPIDKAGWKPELLLGPAGKR